MLRAVAELFSALILLIDLVETFWSDHQEQEEGQLGLSHTTATYTCFK